MKRVLLVAASVAMLAGATVAAAQPYQYDQYNQQRGGQYSQYNQQRYDNSRQGYDNGRRGYQEGWQQGYRMPGEYRSSQYRVNDYRNRGWRAPPRGYAYYRRDNGDTVLAAIATGLIASVIADGQRPRYDRYGRPY